MPRISAAIDRANTILRAHGTPFRLRAGHGSRWLSIYESRPGQKVRERAARGYASRDDRAVETLNTDLSTSPAPSPMRASGNSWRLQPLKPPPPALLARDLRSLGGLSSGPGCEHEPGGSAPGQRHFA